jgi:DNA mismatch repair protein MutL
MEVSGYISLPTHLKNDRRDQSLFVNGRPIFDPLLGKAIREGYRNMIPSDRHPVVFLFLKVDPALVDVNVHPAKREVRFARSQDVFAAVRSAVGNALLVGGLPSSTGILPVHSPVRTGEGEPRPFDKLRDRWDEGWKPAMFPKLETLFDTEKASLPQVPAPLPSMNFSSCEPSYAEATAGRPRTPLFQIANTYIVTMLDGELALIDQHAAHEKILFEKFSQSAATTEVASQQLLVPITLDLNAKEAVLFAEQQPALNRLGFEIEPFGGTTFLIRAVPAEIADQNISEVLQATFSELIETEHGRIDQDALLKMMACKAAVKAGDALKPEELSQLVRQLQTNPALRTCPHGRPVVVKMTQKELAKMFGR